MKSRDGVQKVLAVASGGGHWIQLLRLRQAFEGSELVFMTTLESYRSQVHLHRFYAVDDANRWNRFGLLKLALQVAKVMLVERPHVVISTGAAVGYFAVRIGKLIGARTIWVDSVANVETLSLSGDKIGSHADLWLTQWPHLAKPEGPHFAGAVL